MRSVYMAKRYLCLFVPFACILELLAFNLDLEEPQIYGGRAHTGEYFGYAVALDSWGTSLKPTKWAILVGAPLGNKTGGFSLQNRYGSMYRCPNDASEPCRIVRVDSSDPKKAEYEGKDYDVEFKTGQMLGATIQSKNGRFVVCAPRYTKIKLPTSVNRPDAERQRYLIGRCFYYKDNQPVATYSPCDSRYSLTGSSRFKMCQAGFSAALNTDGKLVSMGLPGFKGTISIAFADDGQNNKFPVANTDTQELDLNLADMMGYAMTTGYFKNKQDEEIVSSSPRSDKFKGKVAIYRITSSDDIEVQSIYPKDSDNIKEGSYFGGSLCAVDLNNDGFSDLLVGAPLYTELRDEGRVYVYMNNKNGALNLNKDMILKGDNEQDARFGFSIAAVGDLNRDGFQDVAVGAPYEDGVGAVYIYLGSANGINNSPKARQKIVGSKYSAGMKAFGFSLAGNVDVDKNGYPDIAVGAVESDQAMLLRTRPIIAVQGVVKLNTQQIVLETNDAMCQAKDKTMHKCIDVTVCFTFNRIVKDSVSNDVEISYSVDLDKNIAFRRLFIESVDDSSRQISYKANFSLGTEAGKEMCDTKRTILLQQHRQIGDLVNALTFDLTYDIKNPPKCSPNLCPILDALSGDSFRAEARFLKHCKNQQICKPDLAVMGNVTFRGGNSFYEKIFIGLVDTMFVNLHVKNNDEDAAYSSEVTITYPSVLSYIGPEINKDVQCETKKIKDSTWQQAVCKVGNPLRGRNQKYFFVEFATTEVQGNFSNFALQVEATSASNEATYNKHQNNNITLPVNVIIEADLFLDGFSEPDQVVYRNSAVKKVTRVDQIGTQVLQKLIVKNRGPSSVDGATVSISVPTLYDADDPESYLLYLMSVKVQGGSCNVKTNSLNLTQGGNATVPKIGESKSDVNSRSKRDSSGNMAEVNCKTDPIRCLTFTCKLGQLSQGDSIVIEMYSRFWQGTLYKVGAGSVDLVTVANVSSPLGISEPTDGLENNEKQIVMRANPESVTPTAKGIQWWIIVLAVLGALLLLAGVIFLMYKKGFFQRKKPPNADTPKDEASTKEETIPMSEPFPASDC